MYKKIISLILSAVLIFISSGCAVQKDNPKPTAAVKTVQRDYIKSVWITYYELSNFTAGKSESEFKSTVKSVLKDLKTRVLTE